MEKFLACTANVKYLIYCPNQGHIYSFDYRAYTAQSEQKALTLVPEGKQAWDPGGMNATTETHLPEMLCPSLLN